jgi:hypothetical protein
VSAAQAQIFVRLLIGIMREALKLIEKRFLASTLGNASFNHSRRNLISSPGAPASTDSVETSPSPHIA